MEPAPAGQALSSAGSRRFWGGRLGAALLSFGWLAAACAPPGPARVAARWRVGLGACALAADADGRLLAVACARSNDVWLLDLPGGDFVARVDTLPRPRAVIFDPGGRGFYVAAGLTGVALVGMDGLRVERRFDPPIPLGGFAVDPAGGRLFCSELGLPELGVYRPSDMHLETSLDVGGEVQAVRFAGPYAWVVTRRSGALARVSLKRMSVEAMALAGPDPGGLALDTDAGLAYVACRGGPAAPAAPGGAKDAVPGPLRPLSGPAGAGGEDAPGGAGGGVAVLRLSDVRRVDYLPVDGAPFDAALSPDRRVLAVACADGYLRFVDLGARRVAGLLPLGGRPGAMLPLPDGGLAVALRDAKEVLDVEPGSSWR